MAEIVKVETRLEVWRAEAKQLREKFAQTHRQNLLVQAQSVENKVASGMKWISEARVKFLNERRIQ